MNRIVALLGGLRSYLQHGRSSFQLRRRESLPRCVLLSPRKGARCDGIY